MDLRLRPRRAGMRAVAAVLAAVATLLPIAAATASAGVTSTRTTTYLLETSTENEGPWMTITVDAATGAGELCAGNTRPWAGHAFNAWDDCAAVDSGGVTLDGLAGLAVHEVALQDTFQLCYFCAPDETEIATRDVVASATFQATDASPVRTRVKTHALGGCRSVTTEATQTVNVTGTIQFVHTISASTGSWSVTELFAVPADPADEHAQPSYAYLSRTTTTVRTTCAPH